ncbi:hypothetical protein ALC60_14133 [Trachymyrmex zeteki]|uniref:Uncharacterized protein n=1 Tax=Mycetomoellerius zeteki TaxID=64791 RepID=A0A151WG76_9HYME|nr:hypothetical protein ALC60_14133 [Trachymyrmex zeteki]
MKPRKAGSVCGPRRIPASPPPQPPPSSPLGPALRAGCCVTGSDTSCGIPAHREGRNNGRRAATGETMTGLPSPVNNVTLRGGAESLARLLDER